MDIRQLKFFLAVVDHNGFSRAAQHLLVAQPSLSQAIATFERELGMPLFHRIGRGVVLSEAGTALVGPARVVLRDLDEAKATMRALKGLRGGRIDLVTMPSPGMEPLTTILTSVLQGPSRGDRQCRSGLHAGGSADARPFRIRRDRCARLRRAHGRRRSRRRRRWNAKPWC